MKGDAKEHFIIIGILVLLAGAFLFLNQSLSLLSALPFAVMIMLTCSLPLWAGMLAGFIAKGSSTVAGCATGEILLLIWFFAPAVYMGLDCGHIIFDWLSIPTGQCLFRLGAAVILSGLFGLIGGEIGGRIREVLSRQQIFSAFSVQQDV
jgi:hypothetical protein